MNWDALGSVAELLGALAVVASLFYIGTQIRYSAKVARANAFQNLMTSMIELNTSIMLDPEFVDLAARALDGEELENTRYRQYSVLVTNVLRFMEIVHYQVQLGVLDPEDMARVSPVAANHLNTIAGKRFWEGTRARYPADFQAFIDQAIADLGTDRAPRLPMDPGTG
jgi:hypothetical protein